ncbi:fructosamine kinase family protein [Amphritea sp. HPY]|uniref:fructosamine kinase family protein n=1 Tax=Amphritea sp. HPY TaxID=3421652 RepID=UPI003D7D4901
MIKGNAWPKRAAQKLPEECMSMPDLIPPALTGWLVRERLRLIASEPLCGGSVASVLLLTLQGASGTEIRLVLKQMAGAGYELFEAEAEGLKALHLKSQGSGYLRVPQVCFVNSDCLLMEYLPAAGPVPDYDQRLGRGLALQHQQKNDYFGFSRDTFCGGTRQPNTPASDGYDFFARQRLQVLAERCVVTGRLTRNEQYQIEQLSQRLPQLIPSQPAVMLHGDLWSGNVLIGPGGEPVLIDPAVWFGWAEAELAMTLMFGGFSRDFYAAYAEAGSVEKDWRQRADLYNLYHYLNHLLLFGGAYHSDVKRIVQYYSA